MNAQVELPLIMHSHSPDDYHIGIICALSKELRAVRAILDEEHEPLPSKDGTDHNNYVLGRVGKHNVVAAGLPAGVYGTNSSASIARDMLRTFQQIRFGLLVGIAGGIPGKRDIRLGDVVVSQPDAAHGGTVQYDFVKLLNNGQIERKGSLNKPPQTLLTALTNLQASLDDDVVVSCLKQINSRHPSLRGKGYYHQGFCQDQLNCTKCDPSRWWWILWVIVVWLWPFWRCEKCDNGKIIRRPRSSIGPVIHYGTIASGNTLLKNASRREQLARELGALCVEMEAAGLDDYPCLVIRGICDYADQYKNDRWQEYASLTAAAFARILLGYISPEAARQERLVQQVIEPLNEHFKQTHAHQIRQEAHYQQQETHYQTDKQRSCHQAFKTSRYEQHKNDRIPERAPETCKWLLDHPRYQQWRKAPFHDLLWISADPGCGKSVLSKFLVDHELRGDSSNDGQEEISVCYFFFKDNDEQNDLATALCAVIHQLFSQQPHLIRTALPAWNTNGSKIVFEIDELWRILQAATTDQQAKPVVCVFDALDECHDNGRKRLISKLCQFHDSAARAPTEQKLKFLVTSRPYEDIESCFGHIDVRLRGEDAHDQIREEIDSVVRHCVQQIVADFQLVSTTADMLERKLLSMKHRTYLWLYLAVDSIRKTFSQSLQPDEESVELLPASVGEAYEQILGKIPQELIVQVRTVLRIIVGARRPLTIGEMALALGIAVSETTPQSFSDLRVREDHLRLHLRPQCGLFVFINNSRLYLIHQTAKEFLLTDFQNHDAAVGAWKGSLLTAAVEREMAVICITYIGLISEAQQSSAHDVTVAQQNARSEFFNYCARYWTSHLRDHDITEHPKLLQNVLDLYDTTQERFHLWLDVWWKVTHPTRDVPLFNDQQVISFSGHAVVLAERYERKVFDLEEAVDGTAGTALMHAAENGSKETVQWLLSKGANANAQGEHSTPLLVASWHGHEEIVQMLIDNGADVYAISGGFGTALDAAILGGHKKITQMLLDRGAEFDADGKDKRAGVALVEASRLGQSSVARMLLDGSSEFIVDEEYRRQAFAIATANGHTEIVQMLLDESRNAGTDTEGSRRLIQPG